MSEWNVLNPYQERERPLHLYLERPPAYFTEAEGGVVEFSPLPQILQKPLVMAESETENIKVKGKISGRRYLAIRNTDDSELILDLRRSGLILVEDKLYRLKGCNPVEFGYGGDILGGQILESAQVEVFYTNEFSSVVAKEGIPTPSKPVGMYKYQTTFNGKNCVAIIFEVKGDTRVDEFLINMEKYLLAVEHMSGNLVPEIDSLSDLFYQFGVQAGSLLRIINENSMTWNRITEINPGNAHIGNYVIFEQKTGETMLGMVDLDAATTWRNKEEMNRVRSSDIKKLIKSTRELGTHSHSIGIPKIEGKKTTPYRMRFVDGFKNGYRKPRVEPIPTESVEETVRNFHGTYIRNFLAYTEGIRGTDKFKQALQRLRESLVF